MNNIVNYMGVSHVPDCPEYALLCAEDVDAKVRLARQVQAYARSGKLIKGEPLLCHCINALTPTSTGDSQ